jgi:uncharacterized membrane protein YfcA
MSLTPTDAGIIVAAGFLAGAVNAAAGGGSLISFPALLLAGLPALSANVTNTVALSPGYAGGVRGYQAELVGQRSAMRRLGAVCSLGALLGVFLLTQSSSATFRAVVPYLLLAACGLLAAQRPVGAWVQRNSEDHHRTRGLDVAQFVAGVYGAYFGAGLGVMLLAVLGVFAPDDIQRLNALKSYLSLIINVLAAILFALMAPVHWAAVALMAPASLLGGFAGARLARRLPAGVLRGLVISLGVGVAISMLA